MKELLNPFEPASPAIHRTDFFGREREIRESEIALRKGSILIEGGVGIGKSSLQAHLSMVLEGFSSGHRSETRIAVAHPGVDSIDQAAHLLLSRFVEIDEKSNRLNVSLGSVLSFESSELVNFFKSGRHVEVLKRVLDRKAAEARRHERDYVIICIDEADKCLEPITKLIRVLWTHFGHQHITNVRFVVAGVSPLRTRMIDVDDGVQRCFYKVIRLGPLRPHEARDLVSTRLDQISEDALLKGEVLSFSPRIIDALISISGGHPHVLQLMGSLMIDRLNEKEVLRFDEDDLLAALFAISHEQRSAEYDKMFHQLELCEKVDSLKRFLCTASERFPTQVPVQTAKDRIPREDLHFLVENNVLMMSDDVYALVDEFFWVWLELRRTNAWRDLPVDSPLRLHIAQFNVGDIGQDGGKTRLYIESRFSDQLTDSEKKKILYSFIAEHADPSGEIPLRNVTDKLLPLFGSGISFTGFLNELEHEGLVALREVRQRTVIVLTERESDTRL